MVTSRNEETVKILITGGAGFVGRHLALHLKAKGHVVVVMDNLVRRGSEQNLPYFKKVGISFVHGDVRNAEDFNILPIQFDIVLDTAAQASVWNGYKNPTFDITNNYLGVVNTLEYVRKTGSKMIFWSTNRIYLNQQGERSIYGLSKYCADVTCQEWAKAFNIPLIINRFSCLAGPWQYGYAEQGWLTWFVIAAVLELPITIFGHKGDQSRDILFIPDVLTLIDKQIESLNYFKGEVFDVGGGKANIITLNKAISTIESLTKRKIQRNIGEILSKGDLKHYTTDISKVSQVFAWVPQKKLKLGIYNIIEWVSSHKKELTNLYKEI